jgi:hypothetical protein
MGHGGKKHASFIDTWETKSQFVCSIVVDTCFCPVLLVRSKAWSDEPKYSLLTHVKSNKNDSIGILFGIFLANCRAECVVGPTLAQSRSNWHVLSIKCYLFSIKMKQAHTNCWCFCSAIKGKTMRSWKFHSIVIMSFPRNPTMQNFRHGLIFSQKT